VDAGADGVLVLPPHGNVDLPRYYDTVVAAAGETPVLAYHFPTFSSPGISVAALRNLPVVGVKDSSGDPDRLLETLTTWDKPIYTGSAALLALAGPLGAAGAMLALGNVVPELAIRAWGGDVAAQLELTSTHLTAKGGFPRTIKALTAERFGTSPAVRMG
jgi:4-hydroxy-tetrahydrodipicolinate synthase